MDDTVTIVFTSSFPSAHAMASAVVYLTLGVMLAASQPRWRLKVYTLGLSVMVALLVGMSRLYLGVHWLTDVLAGWLAGCVWALVTWYWYIVRRGANTRDRR